MTKIFVAGHNGMVGSALCRQLESQGVELVTSSRKELDLTNQLQVKDFFRANKFDQVYLAAAKVGGIHANNTYPADFIYQNLMIQNNVIHQSYKTGVKKLLFLGSSCIYPKFAKQPISENELLSGYLEPTNEPYAIAKIAGIKMCESYNRQYASDYRCVMPTNLYGPGDNFHYENSHVIPALMSRFHEAKTSNHQNVTVWGDGSSYREFLHVDDMASACIHVMNLDKSIYQKKSLSHFNVGSGIEHSIRELVDIIAKVVGYKGSVAWDKDKPNGTPRKLMDSTEIRSLDWQPKYNLREGLESCYDWFLNNKINIRI